MKLRMATWYGLALVAGMNGAALAQADRPSQQSLADMGLGGMEIMSDDEGLAIRGFGWSSAAAYGHSWAQVATKYGSAGSENGYKSKGKHFAKGSTLSYAGFELEIKRSKGGKKGGYGGKPSGQWGGNGGGGNGGGHHGSSKKVSFKVYAGGSSWAKAK
jgi:hypothetical protein